MRDRFSTTIAITAALVLLLGACSSPSESDTGDTGGEPVTPDIWEPDVVDVFGPYGSGSGGGSGDTGATPDVQEGDVDAGPPCTSVRFEYVDTSAKSVWVTGSFSDWAPTPKDGALEMTYSGGTWSLETTIRDRGRHYYKFVVDGEEWIPDPTNGQQVSDHLGGRRSIVDVCRARPVPDCGTVNFAYRDSSAKEVKLAGDFTDWEKNAVTMREVNGVWRAKVELKPGPHSYKFIIDGTWKTDPENDETVPDGQGGMNSLAEVECPGG